jgi:general L-amino acid transport system substrate-binding protein
MVYRLIALFLTICVLFAAAPSHADTLKAVGMADRVKCGLAKTSPGFSVFANNSWTGLHADLCRAVAVAVLGDAGKAEFVPLDESSAYEALTGQKVDLLFDTRAWSIANDTRPGIEFAAVSYFDGQGFLARRKLGISSALELSGAMICTKKNDPVSAEVENFFAIKGMRYQPVSVTETESLYQAYSAERCDAYSASMTVLYADRLKLSDPNDHLVFPEVISKRPLGIFVRSSDDQWRRIVRWVLYAMVNAEELGVTSKTVENAKTSKSAAIRRLVGAEGKTGAILGLDDDWAARIIGAVGNYGEVFDRNLGAGSKYKIVRGINALWDQGGILFAPRVD